ncbi:MAG: leucine-rich repeat protein [Muribaculaceae bacterium]
MNILRITAAALALTGTLAAGAETVTVTKSGSLSEAVTDITATELTVSGPVDAADLFWAADNMKSLKTLNLADATIEAYDGEMLKGRVTYPAGAVPELSFAGTTLSSVVFPTTGNITIGEGAFADTRLTTLALPAGVTAIGDGAFTGCKSLTDVTIPATVKIGSHPFAGCTSLKTVSLGATTISEGQFKDCTALTEVKGTEKLVAIGAEAFSGCTSLKNFTFGKDLNEIGSRAFIASGLTTADLTSASGLKKVGDWAFAHCEDLKAVLFNNQAKVTVGKGIFFDCFELDEIKLPGELRSLSAYMFKGDSKATGHDSLPGIDSIGAYALKDNMALQTLTLPSTLTFIGDGAMENATSLHRIDVTQLDEVPMLGNDVWSGIDQSVVILKVKNDDAAKDFSAAEQWKEFKIDVNSGIDDIVIDNPAAGGKATIRGRFVGNELVLQALGSDFRNIRVYDVAGRLVAALDTDLSEVSLDTSGADTDIFIVAAVLADNTTGTLKIIRR